MKIRRCLSVLIPFVFAASAFGGDGQPMGSPPQIDPTLVVRSLPNQMVGPLPGQIVESLSGQIVPYLPGQLVQSLPGQNIEPLPGQLVQALPGQLVRSVTHRPIHTYSGPVILHVKLTPAATGGHSKM
jgi:hypothetical protein